MPNDKRSVKVILHCKAGHAAHGICVPVSHPVPPQIQCRQGQPSGISQGGGGCPAPENLQELVEDALKRGRMNDWIDLGAVEVYA